MTYEDEVRWTREHIDRMKVGGVWAIPRSGLVFVKRSIDILELLAVAPYLDAMKEAAAQGRDVPKSAAELVAYQQNDFDCIAKRCKTAGITMNGREKIT